MFPLHTLGPASSFIRMHPWQRERHIHWVGLTESLEWIQSALAFTGGSRSSPDASSSWCLQHCTDSARLHKSSQAFDLITWKGTIKRESLLFKRLSHLISIVISKLKNNVPPVGWSPVICEVGVGCREPSQLVHLGGAAALRHRAVRYFEGA